MSDRSPEAAQQVVVGALQQAVINQVHEEYGGRDVEIVGPALREAFAAAGLACPPGPWMQAVAVEIAGGRLYVVGNGVVPDDPFSNSAAGLRPSEDATGSDHPAGNPHALWFGSDPKIVHKNPADAVEHADMQTDAVEQLRHSLPEQPPRHEDGDR
ncbi:hypothetical protein [Microlunatus ginsengisoli]|uniref:Uncharacterized protein n=1 Tax=Microlunatus ginsengisoli TaxID=363863 RepID=A0ABP6ZFN3_9ACTN